MLSRHIQAHRLLFIHAGAAILLCLAAAVLYACSDTPFPGDQEEFSKKAEDVPEGVRAAAYGFCERLGGVQCTEWFWDEEDQCWECTLEGLNRRAELDIESDGSFSELELVYDIAEVEKILPDIARVIRDKSRNDPDVFVELSLRRDVFLDGVPDLKDAWSQSGVVLEFQCSNGRDFEIDARGMCVTKDVDDTSDPSSPR